MAIERRYPPTTLCALFSLPKRTNRARYANGHGHRPHTHGVVQSATLLLGILYQTRLLSHQSLTSGKQPKDTVRVNLWTNPGHLHVSSVLLPWRLSLYTGRTKVEGLGIQRSTMSIPRLRRALQEYVSRLMCSHKSHLISQRLHLR